MDLITVLQMYDLITLKGSGGGTGRGEGAGLSNCGKWCFNWKR